MVHFLVFRPVPPPKLQGLSDRVAANVLQLGVVADFSHKSSIEELHLSLPLNCHTKHGTRHYAKLLLALRPSFLSCLLMSFRVCLGMLAWWLFCCFLHGFVRLEKLQMCHQMRWLMLNYILFSSLSHFVFLQICLFGLVFQVLILILLSSLMACKLYHLRV